MKAWVYRTSDMFHPEKGFVLELNSLEDLIEFHKRVGAPLIIQVNDEYGRTEPYPNRELWEILNKAGKFECEIEIEIYDDYRE